ncbi:MAG: hypothetical protein QM775_22585 [Pirellulales bacterium]
MPLSKLETTKLISLLDEPRRGVGDDAADKLFASGCDDATIDALLKGVIKSSTGRVRALGVLQRSGKSNARTLRAFRELLNDPSADVVQSALFGVVFWQDQNLVPSLDECIRKCTSLKVRKSLELAKKSLLKKNPFLFSANFHDVNNVWKLDPIRYKRRIGPIA